MPRPFLLAPPLFTTPDDSLPPTTLRHTQAPRQTKAVTLQVALSLELSEFIRKVSLAVVLLFFSGWTARSNEWIQVTTSMTGRLVVGLEVFVSETALKTCTTRTNGALST